MIRNDVAGSNAYFFNRTWDQYRQEFGSPTSQYWIGLDRLHEISQSNCKIRFDLQLLNGSWYFAQYSTFSVGNISTSYVLEIGEYSGNLYDAMAYHNGQPFSTYDEENDSPYACAHQYYGGFWFLHCARAYITTSPADYVFYWSSNGNYEYLKVVEVHLLC